MPRLPFALLAIGALAGLALADALGARANLSGIGIEIPGVARLSKDREGKLELLHRTLDQVRGDLSFYGYKAES